MGDEDKSFEATPQKLKRAREQGQVVKSQDFAAALFLVAMFALLLGMSKFIWEEIARLFVLLFDQIPNATIEKIGWQYIAFVSLRALVLLIAPFFIVAFIVAVMADTIQVGLQITTASIMPKFDKLNPVNGFKNIFSQRTIIELVKNLIKMAVLGYVGYTVFIEFLPKLLLIGAAENVFAILGILGEVLGRFITLAGIAFFVIGGADYMYQRWKFMQDQKMSFKEMKDEFKNSEGDPHVKAKLRQKRMQMMQRRMLQAVPEADAIVTNPIHMAVALKYNPENMEAPRVTAKGTELFAERIKVIAREHNIPIVENPTVARTLYRLVDIDQEIPADLYQAVAEILMFAWQTRGVTPPIILAGDPQPD